MYRAGNKTITIEFEVSGKFANLQEFLDDASEATPLATFSASCPEQANYELDEETDDRNPICMTGKKVIVTSQTLTISLEGAIDTENTADKYLFDNFLKYRGGIVRITDYLFDDAAPKVYVGYFDRTGLTFPRSGGETATYTYEASSGDFVDMAEVI